MLRRFWSIIGMLITMSMILAACGASSVAPAPAPVQYNPDPKVLSIVAGSEQEKILNEVVAPWCKSQGYTCTYTLKGSVDQARLLKSGDTAYDIFWFASTVFQQVGDPSGKLKSPKPMFLTPLVFAGWKSEMEKLGFVGRDVTIKEILDAVESGKTTTWLTNPTQSNSGATVFFAFMNYFAGNGQGVALSMQQLDSQPVQEGMSRFVRAMDQTPPSTGTLMKDCLAHETTCRTLFTYEALAIEQDQDLVAKGHEPLYVVYPKESLAIADAPMGFLPHQDSTNSQKEAAFKQLQDYLLSAEAQQKLLALGRRPITSIGLSLDNPDAKVFNSDWGIKTDIKLQLLQYPAADVIETALGRYQTTYRQPVHAIYCLDSSGSMAESGWKDVVSASEIIFEQTKAREYYLQAHTDDLTTVVLFSSDVAAEWTVSGNDEAQMRSLFQNIQQHSAAGGTNMYTCLNRAVALFQQEQGENRKRLVILMSDGVSDKNGSDSALQGLQSLHIPVLAIPFGDVDPSQLKETSSATGGAFVEKQSFVDALREATGYK
jgi:Ca-activated chloride channel family protein